MLRLRDALGGLFLLLCAAGLGMLFLGGLLIEPVLVRSGPGCTAEGVAHACVHAECLFENQGPVPTRGSVVIDVWTTDPADPDGARRLAAARRTVSLRLWPGEQEAVARDYPGVPWDAGRTMVRCMPWYAAPRLREKLLFGR